METREFDVVVLGAGPIGQNVAERARAAGLDVAVVERELAAANVPNWACVPSKALLRPVIALADARRVDGARAALTGSLAKLYADGYTGRARKVVDADGGHLLGVTLVGPGVGEILHSATVAVAGRVPGDRLWHAVPCFPTVSELWLRLLETYRDAPRDN